MKGYRFITDDDTSEFCHRVTEALSKDGVGQANQNDI